VTHGAVTHVGLMNHVFDGNAQWLHLANTVECSAVPRIGRQHIQIRQQLDADTVECHTKFFPVKNLPLRCGLSSKSLTFCCCCCCYYLRHAYLPFAFNALTLLVG